MREILYRGKRVDSGEWAVGSLCQGSYPCIYNSDFATSTDQSTHTVFPRVAPETVGQYTGLKDKNGVRIFEGDIVKYARWSYIVRYGTYNQNPVNCAPDYVVGWYLEGLSEMDGQIGPIRDIDGIAARFPALCADTQTGIDNLKIDIIGNIHDNPELLEDTK